MPRIRRNEVIANDLLTMVEESGLRLGYTSLYGVATASVITKPRGTERDRQGFRISNATGAADPHFRSWLVYLYHDQTGTFPSPAACRLVIDVLLSRAQLASRSRSRIDS